MLSLPQVLALRDRVAKALAWVRAIPADRDAKFSTLNEVEVFRRSPLAHKKQVLLDLEAEANALRLPTVGAVLFEATKLVEPLGTELAEAKRVARRAPDPVSAFLCRTGGSRKHIADELEQLIEVKAELKRMRLSAEFSTKPPSKVRDAYARAVAEGDDVALAFFEDRYSEGWPGGPLDNEMEVGAALELRRLIDIEQHERIPAELDQLEVAADEVKCLLARAESLYQLQPVNVEQRRDLAPVIEAGLAELDSIQVEPESEPVPTPEPVA
jgi:hypothetical protein